MSISQTYKYNIKQDRVVAKRYLYNEFERSYIVPTAMFPLPSDVFAVFTEENTEVLTDERIIALINDCPYTTGHCYSNTDALVAHLQKNGVDIVPYVGWLFLFGNLPVHHCFAVIEGKYLIDLADDFIGMYDYIRKTHFPSMTAKNVSDFMEQLDALGNNIVNMRQFMLEWVRYTKDTNMKHSIRCMPLGKVTNEMLYIGSVCLPADGKRHYNDLMRAYPQHPSYLNINDKGASPFQEMLQKKGLL